MVTLADSLVSVDFRTVYYFRWYCRMKGNFGQSEEAMQGNLRAEELFCFRWYAELHRRQNERIAGPTFAKFVVDCHQAENELQIQAIEEDRMLTIAHWNAAVMTNSISSNLQLVETEALAELWELN